MIVPLEHSELIVLYEIELLLAFLLVVHQGIARETRRHDVERQDGCLCWIQWR